MKEPCKAQVIKFTAHSEGFRLTLAVSPAWNENDRVYYALLQQFHLPELFSEHKHVIRNENPSDLAKELHKEIKKALTALPNCSLRIIDIAGFQLGINTLDAIAPDLNALAISAKDAAIVLVPADYLPSVKGSPHIKELAKTLTKKKRVLSFVDQMGKTYSVGKWPGQKLPETVVSLSKFAAAPTEDEFRKKAIRQSHRWFGHFIMPSGAHVRTHYDCYPGVLYDNWLFSFVAEKSADIIEKLKPDTLVGFGLTEGSVMYFACQMGGQMKLSYVVKTSASPEYINRIPSGSKVLLVSDMVLTGKTADVLRKEITDAGSEVVGLLSLLSLENSATHIGLGDQVPVFPLCRVKRVFYPAKDKCPMCGCGYPSKEVHSADDFRQLQKVVHPYDFWEAVFETKAFSSTHYVQDGKHYTYYIDIEKLCSMYAEPIARQLLEQLKPVLDVTRPKIILYPESNAARKLAEAVARRLNVAQVVCIPRDYLGRLKTMDPFKLPDELEAIWGEQVLVVDDGCNTLTTISAIETLLRRAHANIIGYLVALNRANSEYTSKKVSESKGKFQFYYHWPVAIYRSQMNCPECAAK